MHFRTYFCAISKLLCFLLVQHTQQKTQQQIPNTDSNITITGTSTTAARTAGLPLFTLLLMNCRIVSKNPSPEREGGGGKGGGERGRGEGEGEEGRGKERGAGGGREKEREGYMSHDYNFSD